MKIEEIYEILDSKYKEKYPSMEFVLDKKKFEKDLVTEYEQDLNNIVLPMSIIEKLIFNPIQIREYAKNNGMSYSLMQKNTDKYASITRGLRALYVAEYELSHRERIIEFKEELDFMLKRDTKILEFVSKISVDKDLTIAQSIVYILKEYEKTHK